MWTYFNQTNRESWNNASVSLPNGVMKWKFIAEKVGFTIDSQYAALDHIEFVDSCVGGGMYLDAAALYVVPLIDPADSYRLHKWSDIRKCRAEKSLSPICCNIF